MTRIDLTQMLTPGIPDWEGCCGFTMSETYYKSTGVLVQAIKTPVGIGTHMDAPSHFVKGGDDIASIPLDHFFAKSVVIDVRSQVAKNPMYFLQKQDVLRFEEDCGQIPSNSLILALTGWSQYWNKPEKYRCVNAEGKKQFPGFAEEAIDYLLEKNMVGVGIDTLSPDGSHDDFPVHRKVLGADKYILENLCNLEKLPSFGANIIALPMKIKNGSESPCRVVAEI